MNEERLAWKVYFVEEGKEEKADLLKTVYIKNKAGSISIKITVSRDDISISDR